jgi:repressor LexA
MINAGILDGDLVIVNQQDTAEDGDIVVARLWDEATVKRFFRHEDHVELRPENPSMEPIRTTEVAILGKVVGVVRTIR